MSIKVMSAVWDAGITDQGGLLVMLALADWCNDNAQCWPSMAALAQRARLSDERSARRIVRRLEDAGWLSIDTGGGRHGCNRYTLKLGPKVPVLAQENPDLKSPGPKVPRTLEPAPPGLSLPETRTLEPPEPSITIIEPSKVRARGKRAPQSDVRSVLIEAGATEAAATSFLTHYREKVRKDLSPIGARRLAETLRTIMDSGGTADDALGMAEERGWQTIKANWYFREKGDEQSKHSQQYRPGHRPDPALEQIARLARLG